LIQAQKLQVDNSHKCDRKETLQTKFLKLKKNLKKILPAMSIQV
jgi:hypothetical protein